MAVAIAAAPTLTLAKAPSKRAAAAAVDLGLLEFLGTVDRAAGSAPTDDGKWMAYLSQLPLGKMVAKTSLVPAAAARKQAPAATKPTGAPNHD